MQMRQFQRYVPFHFFPLRNIKLSLYARLSLNNAESNEFVPDSLGETKSAYTRLLFIDRRILLSAWKEDEKIKKDKKK